MKTNSLPGDLALFSLVCFTLWKRTFRGKKGNLGSLCELSKEGFLTSLSFLSTFLTAHLKTLLKLASLLQ